MNNKEIENNAHAKFWKENNKYYLMLLLNKAYPFLTSTIFSAMYSGVFVIHASHTVCVNFFQRNGIIELEEYAGKWCIFLGSFKKSLFHFQNDLHGQPALTLAKQPQILGGYFWEFLVGVCRPLLQILTRFQTKKM